MKKKILIFFIKCKKIAIRIINLLKIHKAVNADTYYPELKQKSKIKKYIENFLWTLKYAEINTFYYLYGFDIDNFKDKSNYISNYEFMHDRNEMNGIYNEYSHVVLLRDKLIFEKYLNSNGIKTAKTIAIIIDGKIMDVKFNKLDDINKIFENTVFIKNSNGECADGVFCIKDKKQFESEKKKFEKGVFIIQEKLQQHDEMNRINPKSVNTIRIVTINNNNKITVLASGLRVGTKKSKNVDNWAAGGLYVEIEDDGKLTKYGFAKPKYGGKTDIHPDSNIKFKEFSIPEYKRVIELVTKAHKTLYGIHSIGWDVAITNEGPALIEGNDNWEISLMQVNHGLKKQWKSLLK